MSGKSDKFRWWHSGSAGFFAGALVTTVYLAILAPRLILREVGELPGGYIIGALVGLVLFPLMAAALFVSAYIEPKKSRRRRMLVVIASLLLTVYVLFFARGFIM